MSELLALPREWLAATGEIGGFMGEVLREVWSLRVLRFFGESLRQAGILIVGSTGVIWAGLCAVHSWVKYLKLRELEEK